MPNPTRETVERLREIQRAMLGPHSPSDIAAALDHAIERLSARRLSEEQVKLAIHCIEAHCAFAPDHELEPLRMLRAALEALPPQEPDLPGTCRNCGRTQVSGSFGMPCPESEDGYHDSAPVELEWDDPTPSPTSAEEVARLAPDAVAPLQHPDCPPDLPEQGREWTLRICNRCDEQTSECICNRARWPAPTYEVVEVIPASDYEALAKRVEELEADPLRLTVEEADTIRTAYLDGTPVALDDAAGIVQRLGDVVDALNPDTDSEVER